MSGICFSGTTICHRSELPSGICHLQYSTPPQILNEFHYEKYSFVSDGCGAPLILVGVISASFQCRIGLVAISSGWACRFLAVQTSASSSFSFFYWCCTYCSLRAEFGFCFHTKLAVSPTWLSWESINFSMKFLCNTEFYWPDPFCRWSRCGLPILSYNTMVSLMFALWVLSSEVLAPLSGPAFEDHPHSCLL